MAVLHLFVAPDARFDGVRDVLADWHAAGRLGDHVWTVSDDPAGLALHVTQEEVVGRSLEAVAASARYERIHLVHLTALDDGDDVGSRYADFVAQRFAVAAVTRIRALFAGAHDGTRFERAVLDGWHTVLLAPEDGAAPDTAGVEIDDPGTGAPALAAALAGLVGLWRGHARSPLDDQRVPSDRSLRLVRSYYRRLDAAEAADAVRAAVLDLGAGLPLPMHAGAPTVRVEDVGLASRTMARQLWERHEALLAGPREEARAEPAKRIGFADALRLFFSFLGAAIRNAPRRWLNRTVTAVRSRTAAVVQGVVFGGGDSAYSVVVGGVTADGRPASWTEQRIVSERLAKALENRVPVPHHAPVDAGPLWQDYLAGALTLADAGDRVPALPPVAVGTRRGVVADVEDIVPGPSARFTAVAPAVRASIGSADVEAYDLLGGIVLRDRLARAATESSIGMPAAEAAYQLQQWRDRHGASYAVQVGGGLARALSSLHAEVRTLLDRLRRAAESGDATPALQSRQHRLTRFLQVLAGVAAVVVAVVVVLAVVDALSPLAAALTVLAVLVAWLLGSAVAFLRGQQALFALLNERALLLSQQEVDERNVVLALRDVRRVSDLYEQFLVWSRVIGSFLAAPLGDPRRERTAREEELAGLPRSVAFAAAAPAPEQTARVANELRREVFTSGWLGEPWQAALQAAPGQLGARGGDLGGRPEAMFQQRGDADGLLVPWQRALEDGGSGATSGDGLWARALAVLERPDRHALRDDLVGRVHLNGASGTEAAAAFLAPTGEAGAAGGRFGGALLASTALAAGRTRVESGPIDAVRDGLGVDGVLVQFSGPIPEYELAGFTVETAPAPGSAHAVRPSAPEWVPAAGTERPPFDGGSF